MSNPQAQYSLNTVSASTLSVSMMTRSMRGVPPFIEYDIARCDETSGWAMDEVVSLVLWGIAEVDAYEGFAAEFIPEGIRDVHESFAAEDT